MSPALGGHSTAALFKGWQKFAADELAARIDEIQHAAVDIHFEEKEWLTLDRMKTELKARRKAEAATAVETSSTVPAIVQPNTAVLAGHVDKIRRLHKRTIEGIIEIGRLLTECRTIVGHGGWLPFLEREFGWTDRTARNYVEAFEFVCDRKLETFPIWGLG
jgi:Protein of unknown function (DUF3102)